MPASLVCLLSIGCLFLVLVHKGAFIEHLLCACPEPYAQKTCSPDRKPRVQEVGAATPSAAALSRYDTPGNVNVLFPNP